MVVSGLTETIDRSILWKKTREKKDDTFGEVAIPVIEKIVSRHFQAIISFIYNYVGYIIGSYGIFISYIKHY